MARKKKKISEARKAYLKERRRIQKYLSRKRYEGYEVVDFELPEIPTRVTQKKLKEIREITSKELRVHLQKVKYPNKTGKTPDLGFMNIPQTKEYEAEYEAWEKKKRKEEKGEEQEPIKEEPIENEGGSGEGVLTEEPIENEGGAGEGVLTEEQEAKLVVEGFLFRVQLELPPGADTLVTQFINTIVNQEGYTIVARTLNAMPDDIRTFLKRYGSDFDFEQFSTEFLDYLEKELEKEGIELGENSGWYRDQLEQIIESASVTGVWDERSVT